MFCVFFHVFFFFFSFHIAQLSLFFHSFSSCPWLLWDVLEFKLAGVSLLSFCFLLFSIQSYFPHYQLPNLIFINLHSISFFHTWTNILFSHPGLYRMGRDYMLNCFSSIFLIT